jgi:hypothetical protein
MNRTVKKLIRCQSTKSPGQEGYFEDYYIERDEEIEVERE